MRVVSTFRVTLISRGRCSTACAVCIERPFSATQGFPNLERARAAKAEKRRQRKLEEWRREELKRTPFALLDEPPAELAMSKKQPRKR